MYAIIRAGGKQAKVQSGDVIEIERVKGDPENLSFAPLLVVDDKGNAVSDRDILAKATVSAKVLGESQGPKVDIFKYKNKTGYRRRQGHRQKYTQIEITEIKLPGAAKAKTGEAEEVTAADDKSAAVKPSAEKAAAAKPAAAKSADKPAAAKPSAEKAAAAKPAAAKSADKPAGAKPAAAKSEAQPAADSTGAKAGKAAKADSSEEE